MTSGWISPGPGTQAVVAGRLPGPVDAADADADADRVAAGVASAVPA
ncbi:MULTISPECIES: hypothetical protein [unclassified Kitasatospora]|nr:hypothetical protein [Kitasatospora sp. GAS204B]